MSPNLHILAGPNGAGKTTFANEFLPDYMACLNFVNADLIAKGLSPFNPQSAAIKAGRLMLEQTYYFADQKLDFGIETTLSGKSIACSVTIYPSCERLVTFFATHALFASS